MSHRQSPLLRLLGEVRNEIYRYAIGGHIIHVQTVDSRSSGPTHRELQSSQDDPENLELVRHRIFPGLDPSPGSTHLTAAPGHSLERVLGLSLACRQLASETALLQYQCNIFQLHAMRRYDAHDLWWLDLGIRGFSVEQRAAVTEIMFSTREAMDSVTH
jgi:hypothetical protein